MAEIEIFHYRNGRGILHRIDTRIKLLFIIFLTICIFNSSIWALIILTAFVLSLFLIEYMQSKITSPFSFLNNVKGFLLFLLLITLVRGLSSEVFVTGILSGLLYSWKLFLLVLIGQLLTSTTDPAHIQGAVYRVLHKVPYIPAGTIATMISLTITFIPLIFDQYLEVRDAANSRLGNLTRNPLTKISTIALPLLQTTLLRADEIAQAMESRCYSEHPTLNEMKMKKHDALSLIILIAIPILLFLLNKYS